MIHGFMGDTYVFRWFRGVILSVWTDWLWYWIFLVSLASPLYSICDNQISNWCREIFKYNTVISIWFRARFNFDQF